jgi:hypothetical protein
VPDNRASCPHCGHPVDPPNVAAAGRKEEREALERRYAAGLDAAEKQGAAHTVARFGEAVAASSAVINKDLDRVLALSSSDDEVLASYGKLLDSGLRLEDTDPLNAQRQTAERLLFPGYDREIIFAALSLDGRGPENYGQVTLVLREEMIVRRASVFEENCLIWMRQRGPADFVEWHNLPPGYRATWADRHKVAVAKLGGKLHAGTTRDEFATLLLRSGESTLLDTFVEVHIYGGLTIEAVESMTVQPTRAAHRTMLDLLEERLRTHQVQLIVGVGVAS